MSLSRKYFYGSAALALTLAGGANAQIGLLPVDQAILLLDTRVTGLEGRTTTAEATIAANAGAIGTLQGRVTTASTAIDANTNAIGTLQAQVAATSTATNANAAAVASLHSQATTTSATLNANVAAVGYTAGTDRRHGGDRRQS